MSGGGAGGGGAAGGGGGGGMGGMGGGGGGLGVYGMVLGGALNILGGVSAGLAYTRQEKAYTKQGKEAFRQVRTQGARVLGQQLAQQGGSGFDINSVSSQATRLEDVEQAEIAALTARYEYQAAAKRTRQQRIQELFSSLNQSIQSMGGSGYRFSGSGENYQGVGTASYDARAGTRLSSDFGFGEFDSNSGQWYGGDGT